MITIKLRHNDSDAYTAVYPETIMRDIKMTSYPMQWERGDEITVCFFLIHSFLK